MRRKNPRRAALEEVSIAREGDTAIITFRDPEVAETHLQLGPETAKMSDAEILDCYNEMIAARDMLAASYEHVAIEVPPGNPQIQYFAEGDQWTPRGDVLRCIVAGDGLEDEDVFVYIDDKELSLRQFGRLMATFAGWGMRITFVPEDELEKEPVIKIQDPKE